jgi:putative transposase
MSELGLAGHRRFRILEFRIECLNVHWFMSFDDGRTKLEAWRRDYSELYLHSALGQKAPIALMICSGAFDPA